MNFFDLREPVSAWSHGAWLLLAVPGSILLWLRATGHRSRQFILLGYTICLALCATASTLYHGVHGESEALSSYLLFDHIGIYLLIAGTYTPIAWTLMQGRWRFATLVFAWLSAILGITLHLACANLPKWLPTGLYLMMGWGSILCYIELTRKLTFRLLRPLVLGGAFYTVGAIINVVGWPALWPGVVGAHEVFHVFVVAGSLAHFQFMFRVIAPWHSVDPTAAAFLKGVQKPAVSSLTRHSVTGFGPGRVADSQ